MDFGLRRAMVRCGWIGGLLLWSSSAALAATYTVNATTDTGSGAGNNGDLRYCLTQANSNAGADVISFAGLASGTITVASTLPWIGEAVTIDGSTATSYVNKPVVEIRGLDNSITFDIRSNNVTIRGLCVNGGGTAAAINVTGAYTGVVVQGCYLGTNLAGTAAIPNYHGISSQGSGVQIGGTGANQGNLISGNTVVGVRITSGTATIEGNTIGLQADGATALANQTGVHVWAAAGAVTIGGTAAGAGNLISGNSSHGIYLQGANSTIQGNTIGLDSSGTAARGNGQHGIYATSLGHTIGGTSSAARNVISGNGESGIRLNNGSGSCTIQGNYIGTNAAGTAALGNGIHGIHCENSPDNQIGGTAAGAGNVVSGHNSDISTYGIFLTNASSGCKVEGNRIGTSAAGTAALPNYNGIVVGGGAQTIGGTTAGAGNLVSGNSSVGIFVGGGGSITGTVVQGNLVGTTANGLAALPNGLGIEAIVGHNWVLGGTTSGARNVIAGNTGAGVRLTLFFGNPNNNVTIQGNYIGLNINGAAALPNAVGIEHQGGSGNVIGGTAAGARNYISGNTSQGLLVSGGTPTIQGNSIGLKPDDTAAGNGNGVVVDGSGVTVGGTAAGAGNVISGNSADGITVSGNNCTIQGNTIGLNTAGSSAVGNANGIWQAAGTGLLVGGTASGARNYLAGNTSLSLRLVGGPATVQGNWFGLTVSGTAAATSVEQIRTETDGHTIGGTAAGAGNVIASTSGHALILGSDNNTAQGNYVGLDPTGAAARPIVGSAIGVSGDNNTVGGVTAAARNVCAASGTGILIDNPADSNLIQGNWCGLNAGGTAAVPNGIGIGVYGTNNTVGGSAPGAGNVCSGNTSAGLQFYSAGSGNQVLGNYLGTNPTGTSSIANGTGVQVPVGSATIGGTGAGEGNLISGNTTAGAATGSLGSITLLGNRIGTTTDGTAALPNGTGVNLQGDNAVIGGTTAAHRNIIAGNTGAGIRFEAVGLNRPDNNTVQGNYLGLNAAGTARLPNNVGIEHQGGTGNVIGGTTAGARNYISGSIVQGVLVSGGTPAIQGNTIGLKPDDTAARNAIGIQISSTGVTVGGTAAGAGNTISGNESWGIRMLGTNCTIQGNLIGLDSGGTEARGNGNDGIQVTSTGHLIGGTSSAARNVISGNGQNGIRMVGGSGSCTLQGNYIGTNAAGTAALGNGLHGIFCDSSPNNQIGGTAAGAGNLVSGHATFATAGITMTNSSGGGVIQGNRIGTDAAGAAALPNTTGIVVGGGSQTIGGTAAGSGNLVSGNSSFGIMVLTPASAVMLAQGNLVGTTADGLSALPNGVGIQIYGDGSTVGGTTAGARNVVAGNSGAGIVLVDTGASAADNTTVQGNYIGLNVSGTAALPNNVGIEHQGGTGNVIGGTTAGARNYLSGNTNQGLLVSGGTPTIQGNTIGLKPDDTAAGNGTGVEITSTGVTVGGTAAGAGNTISGNTTYGISLSGTNGTIQGNTIGLDSSGAAARANGQHGILATSTGHLIGGTSNAARNVISGNLASGIRLNNGSGSCTIQGNYIGTNAAGTAGIGNALSGIHCDDSPNNQIGGSAAGAGNTISGHEGINGFGVAFANASSGEVIEGNRIGTNAAGTAALPNYAGIQMTSGSATVGGTTAGSGNLISGNSSVGVLVSPPGSVVVQGNLVGTTADGLSALPNGTGIYLYYADGATIGGTTAAARNTIAGNTGSGIKLGARNMNYPDNNTIQGNYIGLNLNGTAALANGVGIEHQAGTGNMIGGTASGARNYVSGNTNQGLLVSGGTPTIHGNTIGLKPDDTAAGNGTGVEITSTSVTVGGTAAGAGNIISANVGVGIRLTGTDSTIQGNLIGLDSSGTLDRGNGSDGILASSTGHTIGGTSSAARNVLSGNNQAGIRLHSGSGSCTIQGNYIGTDAAGAVALPNLNGILVVAGSQTIGGTAAGSGNVVSGNSAKGIMVLASGSAAVLAQGNLVGTTADGLSALPNAVGVEIYGDGSTVGGTTAGARNVIAGNSGTGMMLVDTGGSSSDNTTVQGNFIGLNGAGTAALPNSVGIEHQGGTGNVIGGTASGAGNYISGNTNQGILVNGGSPAIQGNPIGLKPDDTAAGNGVGVRLASDGATLGGTAAGNANAISGNTGAGVEVAASNCTIFGNRIGTKLDATGDRGNGGAGIAVVSGTGTQIGGTNSGEPNRVLFNDGPGVSVAAAASQCRIQGNEIGFNDSLGIDLGNDGVTLNDPSHGSSGANLQYPFPVLTSATSVAGTVTVTGYCRAGDTLNFYHCAVDASGFGEGVTPRAQLVEGSGSDLESGTISYSGPISGLDQGSDTNAHRFKFAFPAAGTLTSHPIVATATNSTGNTSEFSGVLGIGGAATQLVYVTQPRTCHALATAASTGAARVSIRMLKATKCSPASVVDSRS